MRIPPDVVRALGYYVYLYVDPLGRRPFYVGKGRGSRCLVHLNLDDDRRKTTAIRAIRKAGREPEIEILAHGLPDEASALRIEAAVIDLLGMPALTNEVRGWRSLQYGRQPLADLIALYDRKPVTVKDPAILIRINQLYRAGMTALELYDSTRSAWRVGERRQNAKFVLSVFDGVVREVYSVAAWLPAGTTMGTHPRSGEGREGRWEFVGRPAPENVRRRYVNRDVSAYFSQGAQNPIVYVNVP